MICDDCKKLRKRVKNGRKYFQCAVLTGEGWELPIWGPECAAYSDDPGWKVKADAASKTYKARVEGLLK